MEYELLKLIAKKDLYSYHETSTKKISEKMNLSQQSISRILIKMEKNDLIKRETSSKGIKILITKKGRNKLKDEFYELKKIIKPKNKLKGKLFKGIGEGCFYINKYSKKLEKLLGYKPYLGTLNIKVKKSDYESFISGQKSSKINEFKKDNRTYGPIKIYNIIFQGIEAAIIRPERTIHSDEIVEIIGPVSFRSTLNLIEGDIIEIERGIENEK